MTTVGRENEDRCEGVLKCHPLENANQRCTTTLTAVDDEAQATVTSVSPSPTLGSTRS